MAYLPPNRQDQVGRHLRAGGEVVLFAGPRRSGLTNTVRELVPSWASPEGIPLQVHRLDLRGHEGLQLFRRALMDGLHLSGEPETPAELCSLLRMAQAERSLLIFVENFHRGEPAVQSFFLEGILNGTVPHGTGAFPRFIVEGACDFDAILGTLPIDASHQPLLAHVEPMTPWRMIVDIEQMISRLSSTPYPLSLVVWLADMTAGDTGFCNEFLLRLVEPNATTASLNAAYEAIVSRGATARQIRDAAARHSSTIELLSEGGVLPGLPPPSATSTFRELYLAGIAEYDPWLSGYRLRSPMVADALSPAAPPPGRTHAVAARSTLLLWEISRVEMLLRTAIRRNTSATDDLLHVTVPAPWKGRQGIVRAAIAKKLAESPELSTVAPILMPLLSEVLRTCLPEEVDAGEAARDILTGATAPSPNPAEVLDGFSFAGIANLARKTNIVSSEERTSLETINARRNDAAHFRVCAYDDINALEQLVRKLLPSIVRKMSNNQ